MTAIYRAEVIGSLLRPGYLKEARRAWEAGGLLTSEFKRIEDRAVNEAIALQEGAGFDVITDGEMRRFLFTGSLTEAIDGLSPTPTGTMHWLDQFIHRYETEEVVRQEPGRCCHVPFSGCWSPARSVVAVRWQPRSLSMPAARLANPSRLRSRAQ